MAKKKTTTATEKAAAVEAEAPEEITEVQPPEEVQVNTSEAPDDEPVLGELVPAEEAHEVLEKAIQVAGGQEMIRPLAGVEDAVKVWNDIVLFIQEAFVYGLDWGVIDGIGKPMIFKSGAERVKTWFGFVPRFESVKEVEDFTGDFHNGEPFFFYRYKCVITWGNHPVGEAIGSCNSWEKKYRYRIAEMKCPNCGQETVKKSKFPPRNDPNAEPGWYCYAKIGGCGAEFDANDTRITEQPRGKVPNADPAEIANTVDKMAQKRAFVSAIVMAAGIGGIFTVDAEDFYALKNLDATTKVNVGGQPAVSHPTAQSQPTAQSNTGPAVQGLGKRNAPPKQAAPSKTAPPPRQAGKPSKASKSHVAHPVQVIMDHLNLDTGAAAAIATEINAGALGNDDAIKEAASEYMLNNKTK